MWLQCSLMYRTVLDYSYLISLSQSVVWAWDSAANSNYCDFANALTIRCDIFTGDRKLTATLIHFPRPQLNEVMKLKAKTSKLRRSDLCPSL